MAKKISGKALFNVISMTVPIGFIIYFFMSENGLIDLSEKLTTFNWLWILGALLCQFGNIAIDAYVLFRFTNNYDKSYTLAKAIKATAIGQFYSVITPGAVGGQPMQLYCMRKQDVDMGVASSSLIQKFLVYQTTITIYSLIALL
ncbi:MAG: flippase-like domain-containing protein, partial [Clostridia bacterium]|nr:flippase-like domain-containing protein [Clostridia bacterium]